MIQVVVVDVSTVDLCLGRRRTRRGLYGGATAMTTVSTVIPVHNGEAYLAEAIGSTLSQTHPPIEVLVVDDGSTDATPSVAREFGDDVRYVRQDQSGVSAARNHGVQLARGELVAFLDHDDAWLPPKLERQVAAIESERATMAICALNVVDGRGTVTHTTRLKEGDLLANMLIFDGRETISCSSTGVCRREEFLRAGGFDVNLGMSADWDLLVRMLLGGKVVYVDEPLTLYRVHGTNMSRNIGAMERDLRWAFAKTFADPRLPAELKARKRFAYGRLYRMLAGSYRLMDDRRAFLRTLAISLFHDPRIGLELLHRAVGARLRRRATGEGGR
jgi:glycosyltransferase involved in cell wall biosynthesis